MVSCHGLRQPRVPFPSLACWYTVVPSLEALDVLSVNTMKYEALQKLLVLFPARARIS